MFLASVRHRLFIVITGMALLASGAIGVAYVATETERLHVRSDAAVRSGSSVTKAAS